MSIQPTDKYLMADYRFTLGTNDAPQMINTENAILPVAVINNGLPVPKSNQSIRLYNFNVAADTTTTIETVTSTRNVYFLGISISSPANASLLYVNDQSSGALSVANGATDVIYYKGLPATASLIDYNPILPIKLQRGLRIRSTNAVGNINVIVYYMVEDLI